MGQYIEFELFNTGSVVSSFDLTGGENLATALERIAAWVEAGCQWSFQGETIMCNTTMTVNGRPYGQLTASTEDKVRVLCMS